MKVHLLSPQVSEENASLTVTKAKRDDTGQYKLFLKNKHGFDTVYCKVTVLGKTGCIFYFTSLSNPKLIMPKR